MLYGFGTIAVCALLVLSVFALVSKDNFKGKELLLAFIGIQVFLIMSNSMFSNDYNYPFLNTENRLIILWQSTLPILNIIQWIIFYLFVSNLIIPKTKENKESTGYRTSGRKELNMRVRIDRPRQENAKWIALAIMLAALAVFYLLYKTNKGIPL